MVNGGKIEAVKVQLPVMTMPSRLPQKRDSKIPSPNQSSTIHTAKNFPSQCSSSIGKKSLSSLSNKSLSFIGKASRSSSLSSSVSSTSLYAGGCNDISQSSTATTASTTTSTASATNINSSSTSVTQFTRSIRPPRSSLPGTLPASSPAKPLSVLHTRSSVPGRGAASNSVYGLKGRPVKREESSPSPRASPVTEPKSCRISIRSSVTTGGYGSPKLSPANQTAFSGPQENTLRSSFRKESQKPSLKPKPLTRSIGIPLPKSAKTIPSSSGINSIQAQTTPSRINSPISMNGAKISVSSSSSPRSDLNAKKMASVMKKSEENVLSLCPSVESDGKTDTHQETIKSSSHIEPSIVCASVSANKLESNVARVSPIRRGGSIVKQTVLNYNQNDVKLLRPRVSTPEPSKETGKDSPDSCASNTYEPSEPESDKDTVKSDNLCTKSSQKESQSHHNHNSKKPITDDDVVASSSDLVYLSVVKNQQQVDSTELTKLVDDDNLSSSEKSTSEPVTLSNISPPSFPLPPPPPPPPLTSLTGCKDEAHQISKSPPPIPERTLSPTKSRPDSGSLSPSSSSSSSASSATESSSISIDTESSIGCETNPTIKFPLFESMTMDNNQRPQSLSLQSIVNRRPKCSLFSDLDFVTPARYERRSDIGSHEFKSEHKYPPIHVGPSHQPPTTDLNGSSATPPPLGLTASLNGFKRLSKTGEYRGSAASLLSNSSSFSANEERQSFEIKKLKDELNRANIKVETLTSQLKSSNEMIQTFGQSLETLRTRLHQCSLTTEQKDREINRLKSTIENLRNECSSLDNGCGVSEGGDEFPSDIESRRERLKKRPKEPRSPSTDREEPGSGWFRGSITRAFGKKNRARNKICSSNGEVECANGLTKDYDSASLPGTPIIGTKCLGLSTIMNGNSISTVNIFEEFDGEMVSSLKKQLREKEKQLNDIRLEALLTASQMESINEKVNRMTKEMINLRNENQCLQSMLQKQSTTSNTHSLTNFCDLTYMNQQGRKVFLKILGKPIGYVIVDPKIDRNLLDIHIRRVFDEFLAKIHSEKLGISSDCLKSYSCDDEFISRHSKTDENGNNSSLPCIESLIKHNSVNLELKSKLDCLAIDLNTPKSTLDKLVNVLRESGRLIICGPAHCGKSYLASKVCQFVLQERLDSDSNVMSINVRRDENCRKEIESLVKNILFCEKSSLPGAIVFKNIHNMPEFSSLLSSVKSVRSPLPIIVCTMSAYDSSRCSTLTDMQLCHNFQSVLFCETNEPCKSFISRVLRRRAIDEEIDATFKGTSFNFQLLSRVIDWLERLHHHIDSIIGDILPSSSNSSLFTSQDFYTKVFLSCPLNHETSRDWFIETWNCKIFPNIQKIIENHNTSTLTSTTHNSSDIFEHFPWPTGRELCFKIQSTQEPSLEYPCKPKTDSITNQLHDTLMRLQEATNG